ncbi:LytTR family DNA-binding domain-containing protein [Hymenobacter koreensis]|uniref:LytTR family DNA-binding domain-containing protein n=1 Tax=Hymenobacter koreensis TaxID=1084523 RepID=A0ABP8JE15_9BACT
MTTLRTLAIDDEPLALRVLAEHARRVPFLHLTCTTDPIQGLVQAQGGDIDLVLLDVQMAALSGMQFLQLLQGRCAVILTTAYPHFALEGYEYAVADYLLKPISFERFLKAVQRVYAQVPASPGESVVVPSPAELPAYSFIKTEHRLVRVNHADIRYIEGGRDYATVFTATERILTLTSLGKLSETLPHPPFMRVHKSYIVALNQITSVERQRIYLGQAVIPIGDTYRADFARVVGSG